MDSRKLACIVALAGLTACGGTPVTNPDGGPGDGGGPSGHLFMERNFVCAGGAAQPCDTNQPTQTDEQRTHALPNTIPAGEEQVYVVSGVQIPGPDDQDRMAGFNLDAIDTGPDGGGDDCEHDVPDNGGLIEGQIGIDNQLGIVLSSVGQALLAEACMDAPKGTDCIDFLIGQQIAQGDLILLVRVAGINDYQYDDRVMVDLALGTPTVDADPAVDGVQPMIDGATMRIASGQTFTIAMSLGAPVQGDIYNGRLRVQTPTLPISIAAGGFNIMLPVSNAEIRFDIAASAMTNGMIGGSVLFSDVIEIANQVQPGDPCSTAGCADCCAGMTACRPDGNCPSAIESTIAGLQMSYADIDPSTGDPFLCNAISLGMQVQGVDATIQP